MRLIRRLLFFDTLHCCQSFLFTIHGQSTNSKELCQIRTPSAEPWPSARLYRVYQRIVLNKGLFYER